MPKKYSPPPPLAEPAPDGWFHRRSSCAPVVASSTLAVAGQEDRGSKPTNTKTAVSRARNLYSHRRRELSYRWAVFERQAKRRNHEVDLHLLWWHGRVHGPRPDPKRPGYALGNVVPCCAACNSMKGKLTLRSFVERTRIIRRKFGQLRRGRSWSF